MTALAKNFARPHKVHQAQTNIVGVAATEKIYLGAFICRDTDGHAIPGEDAASLVPLGVTVPAKFDTADPDLSVTAAFDNTDGADGVITGNTAVRAVVYDQAGEWAFALHANSSTPKVGNAAYLSDDNTVTADGTETTYGIKVGVFTRPAPSPSGGWFVDISKMGGAAQATIAALTDSTGGTANDTLVAIGATNGGDVSGDIENNFADLAAKVNAIRTALITARIIPA